MVAWHSLFQPEKVYTVGLFPVFGGGIHDAAPLYGQQQLYRGIIREVQVPLAGRELHLDASGVCIQFNPAKPVNPHETNPAIISHKTIETRLIQLR